MTKILFSLCLGLVCMLPYATLAQSHTDEKNYSRLTFDLVVSQPIYTGEGVSAASTHNLYGVGIGYLYGIKISGQRLPLFLEVGPECTFVRRTDELDYWDGNTLSRHDELETQILCLGSPINLTCHYHLNNDLVLAPSAGLTAKVNLLAKTKSEGKSTSMFDDGAHRFQLGWNIGGGLYVGRYYVGLCYTADVTSLQSHDYWKERFQNFTINLGLTF